MRVWIDQDLCTGDGLCVDHCPDVFVQLEDGIAYVAEGGRPLNEPGGAGSLADVPRRHYDAVVQAADVCPGECIFIEVNDPAFNESQDMTPMSDVESHVSDDEADGEVVSTVSI